MIDLPTGKKADRVQRLLHLGNRHLLLRLRGVLRKRQLVAAGRRLIATSARDGCRLPKVGIAVCHHNTLLIAPGLCLEDSHPHAEAQAYRALDARTLNSGLDACVLTIMRNPPASGSGIGLS